MPGTELSFSRFSEETRATARMELSAERELASGLGPCARGVTWAVMSTYGT